MKVNHRRVIAWILCGLCILGAGADFVLWLRQTSLQFSFFELLNALSWILVPLVFSVLAALVISRQPGNRVGWLMMVVGVAGLGSASPISSVWASLYPVAPSLTPGLWLLIWFDNYSWIFLIFPIFLIPLHFPTGKPPSRSWNWVNLLAIAMALFLFVAGSFVEKIGPMAVDWVVTNPLGFIPTEFFEGPFLIFWGIGLLTMFAGSITALFVRYRRAGRTERQQIKWLLYAGAFFLVIYGLMFFLIPPDATSESWGNVWLAFGMLSIPVAIAIAILRYRLFDIDLIIRRSLQYSLLTGLLSLVYFGGVAILSAVAGQTSPVVIVLTTLLTAALFNPLRNRLQSFIDRRFYRQKYDAEKALAEFAAEARSETDFEQLANHLTGTVQETLQPENISLWMQPVVRQKQTIKDRK